MPWVHRKVSRYRTRLPQNLILGMYLFNEYPPPPRGVQNRAFPPDASKSPEKDSPREPIAVVLGQVLLMSADLATHPPLSTYRMALYTRSGNIATEAIAVTVV